MFAPLKSDGEYQVVGIPVLNAGTMTVDAYYAFTAFTDTRPDHEKWELIAGAPVLNAAPDECHQAVVGNVVVALVSRQRAIGAPWPRCEAVLKATSWQGWQSP